MFSQASVILSREACMAGGGRLACVAKGGGGCVAGGMRGGGGGHMRGRRDGHCSGRYPSYWNVFVFFKINTYCPARESPPWPGDPRDLAPLPAEPLPPVPQAPLGSTGSPCCKYCSLYMKTPLQPKY